MKDLPDRMQKSAVVQNLDSRWSLTVVPTQKLLETRDSIVPLVVLSVGLIMAFLVSFCTFLILKGSARNHVLQMSELALEASNRMNKAILSSTGYVLAFNSQAERSLGYSVAEVVGKLTPAIWHDPKEVEARAEELSDYLGMEVKPGLEVFMKLPLLKGNEEREWTLIRKDGTRFPVMLSVTPLHGDTHVAGFLGVLRDITEQKEMENALKESEETFRKAMEHASIGMALVGLHGEWRKVNYSLCQLLGYSESELLRTEIWKAIWRAFGS
jgi:PAS domain-containing protein